MSERIPPIHLDDLAKPVLPDEVRAAMSAMSAMAAELPWHLDGLMAAARKKTGLTDFGEDLFSEPFAVILDALDREGGLSPTGRVSAFNQLSGFLANRLLIEHFISRHPQALDQEITAPLVIAGLPRTGTTHLHNLISADPAMRSLPWWEALEPVPPLAEQGQVFEHDPRIARAAEGLAGQQVVLPHFNRMHDMWPEHAHEEIHLLAIAGSTMFFETLGGLVPSWRDWYLRTDQTPWYAYTRKILQVLQYQRGGERWILKSPQHLEQFRPLLAVYPDATFIVTHRDPVSVTASFATMSAYSARMSRDPVDPPAIGAYWADRVERQLHACVRDRELLSPTQSIDVRFHEFMADDIAMVQRIYALAGQPFDERARAAMAAFMAEHPRGKHGRVLYDLADFGIDRAERRSALAFYLDRFDVAREGEG